MELTKTVIESERSPRAAKVRVALIGFSAVAAVGIATALGFGLGHNAATPAPFNAKVIAVSDSGNSLCIDREEESCGIPIIHPDHRALIGVGDTVVVTKYWIDFGEFDALVFAVAPIDEAQ